MSAVSGVLEDGTEISVTTEVRVELTGTVKSVVSMENGYDDPTGRTVYLTLVLPDMESLDALALTVGQRYLVYGEDYLDGNWALRGYISDGLSAASGSPIEITELDEDAFLYFTPEELEILAELNPYSTAVAQYWYGEILTEIPAEMLRWKDAVMLTLEDKSVFGVYESVDYSDGSGSYPNINWDRWVTDENGALIQITQEEYEQRYSVPTIVEIDGAVEAYLQSEDGQPWAKQIELMEVNYRAFPVVGVEKLGYVADFARETARIVEGRDFTQEELESGAKVCLLSETLAAANGLGVGDRICPRFYNYDWDSPCQAFVSGGNGVVNPSAYRYTANTAFAGSAEDYVIVGLYRQDNAWGDVSDNLYSFTPNTIFVPHSSVSSDMDHGDQGFFQTLVLKNGSVAAFRNLVDEAGYEGLFIYYDQGYTTISGNLHNYKEVSQRALLVGMVVYGGILLLFLLLFPGSQGKVLLTMHALGAQRKCKVAQVVMTSAGILIPGTVTGILTGMLLWQRIINALAESASAAVTLEMDIVTFTMVALGQLVLALVLTVLIALPMTRDKGIAKRMG